MRGAQLQAQGRTGHHPEATSCSAEGTISAPMGTCHLDSPSRLCTFHKGQEGARPGGGLTA